MRDRDQLLTALSNLQPAQFGRVVFELRSAGESVDPWIPPEGTPPQTRAMELIRYMETKGEGGLRLLSDTFDKIMRGSSPMPGEPILWNLPVRNDLFTGRTDELVQLRRSLPAPSPMSAGRQAIFGPAGQGKTQLALEYVYRNIDEYRAIFWITLPAAQTVQKVYEQIAKEHDLPRRGDESEEATRRALFRWLRQYSPWLLIFDHVTPAHFWTKEGAGELLLPTQGGGHILITTRATDCQAIGILRPLWLSELPLDAASEFLCRRMGTSYGEMPSEDQKVVQELAKTLHQVPLVLEQACSLMQKRMKTYGDLQLEACTDLFYVLSYELEPTVYPGRALPAVYAELRAELEQRAPGSLDLLRIAAMLGTDPVPIDIFHHGAEEMGPELAMPLAAAGTSTEALPQLLEPLLQNSLIQRAANDSFSLNRLVRLFIQNMPDERRLGVFGERAIRAVNRAFAMAKPDVRRRMLPHIAQVTRLLTADRCAVEKAQLTHNAARFLREQGEQEQAAWWLQRSIDTRKDLLRTAQLAMAETLVDLATLELDRNKAQAAAVQCRKALSFLYDPQSLSKLEEDPGQPSLQYEIALYERAIAILERLSDTAGLLQGLDGLSELYGRKGDLIKASELVRRAIKVREGYLGKRHPEVATCLGYLAALCRKLGQSDDAESLLREMLSIWEQVLGPEAPQLLPYLGELADLLTERGRVDEASGLIERATLIKQKHGVPLST